MPPDPESSHTRYVMYEPSPPGEQGRTVIAHGPYRRPVSDHNTDVAYWLACACNSGPAASQTAAQHAGSTDQRHTTQLTCLVCLDVSPAPVLRHAITVTTGVPNWATTPSRSTHTHIAPAMTVTTGGRTVPVDGMPTGKMSCGGKSPARVTV